MVFIPGCDIPLKLPPYANDLIVLFNSQKDLEVLVNTVSLFGCISSAKINWEKSEAITGIGQLGDQLSLPGGLIWRKGELKYLEVFLGNDTFLQKNCENVLHKVNSRLSKWRWLLPHMSYRDRVLVINNLVSSALWHRC